MTKNSTDDHLVGLALHELVLGYLEVQGSRAAARTARAIVVRPMAGAEPAMVVTRIGHRHTTQVRAHAKAHKPLHRHTSYVRST